MYERVALNRCRACRYSFEPSADEMPKLCPQCDGPLTDAADEPVDTFEVEQGRTQKMSTVPKRES